jgi:hypothetical protein
MTTQKTLKRRIRARAGKTGESYTAARAQLLRRAEPEAAVQPADEPPAPEPIDAMALTGVSEAAMVRATGRPIGEWLAILDAWDATTHTHTEMSRWIVAEHGIPGWWAQNVTVAYERARGLRVRHQEPGGFAVSASKTVSASPDDVTDAFTDPDVLARWLPDAPIRLRTSQRGRSARFDWDDPPSRVEVWLDTRDPTKTKIGLGHSKLPDADTAARLKAMWRERFADLKRTLEAR